MLGKVFVIKKKDITSISKKRFPECIGGERNFKNDMIIAEYCLNAYPLPKNVTFEKYFLVLSGLTLGLRQKCGPTNTLHNF